MPAASRPFAEGGGDWRAALDGYLPRAQEEAPGAYTPLALQFELRELTPRTANRWNGPTSRAVPSSVTTLEPHLSYRLGARPVTRTAKGWARGALTWANLPHFLNRLDLDPAQHRWFNQFAALHRAAHPSVPGGAAPARWAGDRRVSRPVPRDALITVLGQLAPTLLDGSRLFLCRPRFSNPCITQWYSGPRSVTRPG